MIRMFRPGDLDRVMRLWLETNLLAHDFVPRRYWEDAFADVKRELPRALVYVYETGEGIQGFIGLTDGYIAGLFVDSGVQSQGIGKRLLDYAKRQNARLTLHVYQKNERAAAFYRREGFAVQRGQTDAGTGETELVMSWKR